LLLAHPFGPMPRQSMGNLVQQNLLNNVHVTCFY
jgi:hypothetical protein